MPTRRPAPRPALRIAALALILAGAAGAAGSAAGARLQAIPAAALVTPETGAEVRLRLVLEGAGGEPRRGLSFLAESNFGSVGAVEERSPGRYEALLRLPPTDMPRAAVAVFTAQEAESSEVHHAVVPVSVETQLRARTEPRSDVTVTVAGHRHGPVQAGRTGWFTIRFVQPPGAETAQVRIADPAGNVQRQDLPVPRRPHDPLTVTLDRYRTTTDGRGRVRVSALAFDELGRPLRGLRLEGSADRGTLGEFTDHGDGVHAATWFAPADGSEGAATLRVRIEHAGARHEESERVRFERGPPNRLQLAGEPTELVAGEQREVALSLLVQDAGGNGLARQPVRLSADRGELEELRELGGGRYESRLLVPAEVGSGSIEVKALLATGPPPKPPTRLSVTANPEVVPTSWRAFSLVTATVTDEDGEPVAGEVVLFHVARGEGVLTPAAVTNADGRAFADFSADPVEEVVIVEAVSTSRPSLKSEARIEKRADGEFVLISRPALAAQGGRPGGLVELEGGERVLQDSVLISIRPGPPAALGVTADPPRLVADGASSSRVTATLSDARGNEIPGASLRFAVDAGTVGEGSNVGDGRYLALYTAPEGAGEGRALVTVSEPDSGLTATTTIELEVGPPAELLLVSDRDELPADGLSQARLTATVLDASGVPVPGAELAFRLDGAEAAVTPTARTAADGRAPAALTAGREAGPLSVTAETDGGLSATVDLVLLPTEPVLLALSAEPESILANGVEASWLEARLEDASGRPVEGHEVDFLLLEGPGTLEARRASSDALGIARLRLTGTRAGLARVRARSASLPFLDDETEVELRPAALAATFSVGAPACAGAVALVSSVDPALAHEWDWTGDGAADATGPAVVAPLPAGTQRVRLLVRDEAGAEAASSQELLVAPGPEARAAAADSHVAAGGCTRLDGTASSASDGGPLAWSWDLDGDGLADADGPVVEEWCAETGERSARLTVRETSGCEASDSVSVVFGDTPVLTVALSTPGLASPVPAGTAFELELRWGNSGRATAPGTVLTLDFGDELLRDGDLPPGGQDLGGGRLRFALGDLAPGAAGSFRIPLRATSEPQLPSSRARALASARHQTPSGPSRPVEAALSLPIVPDVDLSLSCAAPTAAKPGDEVRVTLRLRNDGASTAHDVALEAAWDAAEFELLAAVPPGAGGADALRLDWVRLVPGEEQTVELRLRVASVLPLPLNVLQVPVEASHAGVDADPSDDGCAPAIEVAAQPDGWVSLRATPSRTPARPGDTILYELRYGNRGSAAAEGSVIEGRFDRGVFTSSLVENPDAGVFSSDDGLIRFIPGRIAADPGRVRELRWRARVDGGLPAGPGEVRTEITLRHAAPDAEPADDLDAVTVPLISAPDVSLAATLPASALAGAVVPVVLQVAATGDVPAQDVAVEHSYSGARVQAVASSLPSSASVLPSGAVRFELGDLAVGAQRSLSYELRLEARQDSVDPTLANRWTASFGDALAPETRTLDRDLLISAAQTLDLALTLSASEAAAGESVEARLRLTATGAAPTPAGSLDIEWDAALFAGAPPSGLAFPSLAPGDSVELGPWSLPVRPVLPATRNDTYVTARIAGTARSASAALRLTAAPVLSLRLASLPAESGTGRWVDAVVAHRNAGSTAATAVELALDAPAGLVAELDPPLLRLDSVPADGLERSVSFRVRLADRGPGCRSPVELVPRARLAESPDPVTGTGASLDLLAAPDLWLELTARPSNEPPGPGELISYEVTLANAGDAPAIAPVTVLERDVALLPDVLPPLPAGASVAGSRLTVPWPDLQPGESALRTLRLRVADNLPAPSNLAVVSAEASESSCETLTGNNRVESAINVGSVADVIVAMDVRTDPAELAAGGSVGITLYLSNAGTTNADAVELQLDYPDALVARVLDDGGAASAVPGRLSWTGLALTPGAAPRRFEVSLEAAGQLPQLSNLFPLSARATTTSPENRLDNNRADTTRTVRGWADLCVELEARPDPAPATAAGRLEYLVRVTNEGNTAARGVLVQLDYEASLLSPQGGGADPLEWSVGTIAPGGVVELSRSFQIVGTVPGGTASAHALAEALSPEHDAWGLAGCDAQAGRSVVITEEPDLAVAKSLSWSDAVLVRGSVLQYTLVVENLGNADADLGGASVGAVEDLVPSGLLLRSAGGGSWDGSTLRWDLPARLRRGDAWSATYELEVDPALPAGLHRLTNVARVLPAGPDASPGNDSDSQSLELRFEIDLETQVSCTARPAPASPGSLLEYEARVTNRGSYSASNVLLAVDTAGLVVLEPPLSGTVANIPGPASLGPGATWTYRFTGRSLDAFAEPLTVVRLDAAATADELDADPSNDSATTSCNVISAVDLRAGLTAAEVDASPPIEAGELVDVTVSVENAGSRIESGVEVVVTYDPALAFLESTADFTLEAPGRLRHVHATPFDPRDPPETLRLRLRAADTLPTPLELLQLCATVASPGPDAFPADNSACRQIQLFAAPDLVVTRSVSAPSSPARPGEALSHRVSIENRGTTAATGVVLEHRRDPARTTGLVPGSASHPATESGERLLLDVGSVSPGAAAAVALAYDVALDVEQPSLDGSAVSTACALLSEADAAPADNCADASVPVEALPDAWVELRFEPAGPVTAGSALNAVIDHGNRGSSPLASPELRLELDPELLLAGAGGAGETGPLVLSNLAPVAPGESRQEIVPLLAAGELPAPLVTASATARLSHAESARDARPADDADTATVDLSGTVDLIAEVLLQDPARPAPGDRLTYEIRWRNVGSTTATAAVLTLIPGPLLLAPDGSEPPAPDVRPLGDVGPGASGALTVEYLLPGVMPADSTVVEVVATLASDVADSVPADNTAVHAVEISASSDVRVLSLGVVATPAPAAAGGLIELTAEHDNHGSTAARDARLVLTWDDSLAGLEDAGGGTPVGTNQVVFAPPTLPVGPADPAVIRLRAHAVLPELTNPLVLTAEVEAANEGAGLQGDNAAVQFPDLLAEPDLAASLRIDSVDPAPAGCASAVMLTASIENLGSTAAREATLTLTWDELLVAGVTDAGGADTVAAGRAEWLVGTVEPGAPPLERSLVLQLAEPLPAATNELLLGALAASVDSDANGSNNSAAQSLSVSGDVDLVLSALVEPAGPVGDGDFVFYTYELSNAGCAPAQDPCVESPYDSEVLSHWIGGTDLGGAVRTCVTGTLAPGDPPARRVVMFQVTEPGTGEVRREIPRSHAAFETGKSPADDANPADNLRDTNLTACFLTVSITSPGPSTLCMGSSTTLVANASVTDGVSYEWIAPNGGSFDDPAASVVVFTPPQAAGLYPVHVRVRHSSGCSATTETDQQLFPVRVSADCSSCGCHPANLKLIYIDGSLERADAPGRRDVAAGETVTFQLQVNDTGTGKSATIRTGTSLRFTDGAGSVYTARLAYPVFYECRNTVTLTFNAAEVPPGMLAGTYRPDLVVDAIDACGNGSPRDTSVSNDVTVGPPLGAGRDPGIDFRDWGPRRRGP